MSDWDLSRELQHLYDQVPATRCAHSGECCALTEDEFANNYATMYPLYRAEYRNIVEYAEAHFSSERRRKLFSFIEERPRQCPFLGADHACTIYPVRPLICRTYAVMNPQTIAAAATANQGEVSEDWIEGFVLRESNMVCPRVEVVEPEKLEQHAHNLITTAYERALIRLSQKVELVTGERQKIFQRATWRRSGPLRWSWGGFNAVCFAPLDWMRSHFKAYWKNAELADIG